MAGTAVTHILGLPIRNLSVEALALDVPGPTFDAPWMDWFTGISGWVLATLIALLAIVSIAGVGAWVYGKLTGVSAAQNNGIVGVVLGTVGAAVVTVAGTAIMWATEIGPEWASF